MSADSLPTLRDPQGLFFHLIVYAGGPAAVVAVVTALLASYTAVMGWIGPPVAFWIVVAEIACVTILWIASIGEAAGPRKLAFGRSDFSRRS